MCLFLCRVLCGKAGEDGRNTAAGKRDTEGTKRKAEVEQPDLLRTDCAGEEYFIEEPRDFAQDPGGA